MRTGFPSMVGLLFLFGLGGCVTFMDSSTAMHQQEDMLLLREAVTRCEGRLEALEMEYRRLAGQADAAHGMTDERRVLQSRLDDMSRRLAAMEASRAQDRQEIIDQLSRKMATVMSSAPARTASSRAAASQTGYEHVVQEGETLSAIAAAYKVRVNAIVEANSLQNPNVLRKGQKLFIPQP